MNAVCPIFFKLIAMIEQYHPRVALYWELTRYFNFGLFSRLLFLFKLENFDSKTSKRDFLNTEILVSARKPASFWRKIMIVIVILLRVLAISLVSGHKFNIKCYRFYYLRLGDSLTFFHQDNSANFLVKKMYNEGIRGVYYLRIPEKTLS